jgi:hypothetical protein
MIEARSSCRLVLPPDRPLLPMSELLLPLNPCGNSPSQKWQI